jgi:hypothetical protein
MQDETRATLRLVATALCVLFLAAAGLSAPLFYQQYKVLSTWMPADAEVVDSFVVTTTGKAGSHEYQALYLLSYRVGQAVLSTTLRPDHPAKDRVRAQAAADRYPRGSHVRIVYQPLAPEQIRLEPGYNRRFFAVPLTIVGGGAAFLVLGLILLLVTRPKRAVLD